MFPTIPELVRKLVVRAKRCISIFAPFMPIIAWNWNRSVENAWRACVCTITSCTRWYIRGRWERRVVWREGLVWLFTVDANNFCKSISFRAWNIKRSRERYIYIQKRARFLPTGITRIDLCHPSFLFSLSLSFFGFFLVFSFFFFCLFQRDTFIFSGINYYFVSLCFSTCFSLMRA